MISTPELKEGNGSSFRFHNCGICHEEISQGATFYEEVFHFGVICPDCYANNSIEDIELIANMLNAFGGYFGKLRDQHFPMNEMLKCFLNVIQNKKGILSSEEIQIKLLHCALLHGFTPQEFNDLDEDLLKYMYRF
ncbi:MAG: hypothetical protein ACXAEX_14080 [Promethearchaeota archaeon]|jgi:hypothetical protein